MRVINLIVVHCSATKADRDFTEQDLEVCHRRRGMNGPGYHFYIRKNGDIKSTRPIERIGAHSRGFNKESIGICYEGGLDKNGKAKDTRTDAQKKAMRELVQDICHRHDIIDILGHRDTSPDKNGNGIVEKCEWMKECPCFDVKSEFTSFLPPVIVRP